MPEMIRHMIDRIKIRNGKTPPTTEIDFEEKYKHIKRRKTRCELLRLSCTVMGIEVAYSAITAFVSPIMLQSGMAQEHMSLVWAISPVIGLILSPLIGSMSDRCKLNWGRRRPFILMLAILEITGLILISNGRTIGTGMAELFKNPVIPSTAPVINSTTNNTNTSTNEITKLSSPNIGTTTNSEARILIAVIIILGVVLADFSADALQNPSRSYLLDVCNNEDHAKGLSTCAILAGCGGFLGYLLGSINWNNNFIGKFMGGHVRSLYTLVIVVFTGCVALAITTFKEIPLNLIQSDTKQTKTPRLSDYLKSILFMPYSMKILYTTNLLCWISHVNFSLYFTHFVGEAVFQGNPAADADSDEYEMYEAGVRYACLGMTLYSAFCICYSLTIEKLIKTIGLRYIYMGVILVDSLSLFCMTTFKKKALVLILCSVSGIMYCTIVTVPYILVAHYHTTNTFEVDKTGNRVALKQIRGLGTDISIIGSAICIAQIVLSVVVSQLITLVSSTSAILSTSSFFGFCAAITASQIMYLDL